MNSELMILLKKENDLDGSIMKWIQQCREEELCCVRILKKSDRAIESESETSHKSQNDYLYWIYWKIKSV